MSYFAVSFSPKAGSDVLELDEAIGDKSERRWIPRRNIRPSGVWKSTALTNPSVPGYT